MADTLTQISTLLARILLPTNIFLGIAGNLANIFILTRPGLIKYASSHFFLAMAINNLLAVAFISTTDLLSNGFGMNITFISPVACSLVRYFGDLFAILSSYFIVLASVDRYCASSRSAKIRSWSNVKVARIAIICLVLFFALFYANTPVLSELSTNGRSSCSIPSKSLYQQIYVISQVFIYAVFSPFLIILFGLLTIQHTKRIHVQPARISTRRRTERQLTLMLLVQVTIHLLLNLPMCIVYLMIQFGPQSYLTREFYFIATIFIYLYKFAFSSPFFLYILSARAFRKELLSLIRRLCGRRVTHRIYPNTTEEEKTG